MAERNLKFVLTGEDRSASSSLTTLGAHGQTVSAKIGAGFSKLGGQMGGEFGEVLSRVGEGLESMGEHGLSMGKKLMAGGAAATGLGVLLTAMGSKEKQATDQLKAAIDATGASWGDYSGQVEETVKHEENYAHSAVDTKSALQKLTQATDDPTKALNQMALVTDLAAAKHESLSEAAGQVTKVLAGSGKVLKEFGITMGKNADGTKNVSGALDELSGKLKGQADASMDNFGAKVREVKTKLGDFAATIGEKFGPIITAVGPLLFIAGSAMELMAGHAARAAAAQVALAATTEASGVMQEGALVGVAATAEETSLLAIEADDAAATSTVTLATTVEGSATSQLASFGQVTAGAQAASQLAIAADDAAIASTTALAGAVQASSDAQITSLAGVTAANAAISASLAELTTANLAEAASAEATVAANSAAAAADGELAAAATTAAVAQSGMKLGTLGLVGALAAVSAAAYFGGKAIEGWIEKGRSGNAVINNLSTITKSWISALEQSNGALDDNVKKSVAAQLQSSGLADKAAKSGISLKQLTDAVTGGTASTAALSEEWKKSGKPSGDTIFALQMLGKSYMAAGAGAQQLRDVTKEEAAAEMTNAVNVATLGEKYGLTADQLATLGGVTKKALEAGSETLDQLKQQVAGEEQLGKKYGETGLQLMTATKNAQDHAATLAQDTANMVAANDAAGLLTQGLDALNGKAISAEQANITFKDGLDTLTTTFKTNGKTVDDNTAAGRANLKVVLDQIKNAETAAQATADQTGSVKKGTDAWMADIGAIRQHLTALGLTPPQIQAIIDKYAQIPKFTLTKIEIDKAAAMAQVADVQRRIASIPSLKGTKVTLTNYEVVAQQIANLTQERALFIDAQIRTAPGQPAIGGHLDISLASHAAGGYLSEGWNTAGEGNATELMYKSGSSVKVLTNGQTKSLAGKGGNTYITLSFPSATGWVGQNPELQRTIVAALEAWRASGNQIHGVTA